MKELIAFNFIIIYYKKAKNLINNLFQRPNFKDNSKLSITKYQPLSNFLSKFQEHLENAKNDLVKKQSIDFNEILLLENILNLVGAPQGTNSIRVLPTRNESRDECSGSISNSIDYNQMKIFYFELVFIIERNNDQTEKTQFVFVIGVISCELYIL